VEVKSTLPLQGGVQTIASATLASIAVGAVTPSTTTVSAGTTNYTVFYAPLTISNRAVDLKGLTLKMIGSISTDALANIQLFVNGVATGSTATVDANGMLNFVLATPLTIQNGSPVIEVRADIVKGSSRNFSFSLQNASDLVAIDTVYNVNAAVTGTPKTTGVVSVSAGTVAVSLDSSFSTSTVTSGTSNVTLAKYNFKAFGEDVKISSLDVSSSVNVDNVVIYANGAPITSNQNYTGSTLHFNLGSSLIIPANTTVSVELRADTKAAGVNLSSGTTIALTLVKYDNNAQGVSSSTSTTAPSANLAGPTIDIGTGSLVLAKTSGVADGKITANTANQRIASYVIQAGPTEGVRVNSLSVGLGLVGTPLASLSNLYIKYNGIESTPVNPQADNNFTTNIELAASEAVTIEVFVDLGAAVNGNTIIVTAKPSVTGLVSNSVVASNPVDLAGQTMTVATPSLATPTLASSSPAAQFVLGGSQGVTAANYNFVATDGDITIKEISFTTTNATIASITAGGKTAYVVSDKATITGLDFVIPAGYAGKALPVTVTYNDVGVGGITSNLVSTLTLTAVKYMVGNTLTTMSPVTVAAKNMNVVAGIPTVNLTSDNRTGLTNGEVKLADITVSADAKGGAIKVQELPITVTSTGVVTIDGSAGNNIVVKDASGNTITTTNTGLTVAAGASGSDSIVFTGGFDIAAGESKTFSIYSTAATVGGSVNSTSLGTKLGAKTSFKFTDVEGGVADITGAQIYTYSTNTSTIHN